MDGSADAAAKRAADFSNSFFGMPGYADDSIFFVLRYYLKAETTMSKAEYTGFTASLHEYHEAAKASQKAANEGGAAPECMAASRQKVKDAREKTITYLKDYPELERDFDQFDTASRAAFKAVNSS
ncbi:hypothetical protein HJFPF1_08726 [Paramyrothecium foliicola]|nr:hypothetical protein HJFPF1_08726 [Paramyrothecium foliicola]